MLSGEDAMRRTQETGSTLVEMLLVAFILGVGLLGVAALQMATLREAEACRDRLIALSLAQDTLAQVSAAPAGRLAQGDGWNDGFDRAGVPAGSSLAYFTRTVQTRPCSERQLWVAQVRIQWQDGARINRIQLGQWLRAEVP